MMKKVLSTVLAACMVLSLVACGSSSSSETQAASAEAASSETQAASDSAASSESSGESSDYHVLNYGISADPQDLSPWAANTPGRRYLMETMYQRLAIANGFGGELVGVLMKDYEKVADKTYDVTIYDYIYDTEGNHMTASDVAFSYNKAIELGNMTKLGNIASCEAVDEYVCRFEFVDEPLGNLVGMWSEIPIVTEAAYENSGDGMVLHPVGTTHYKCTDYVSGSTVTFEKTDDFWQTDESLIPYYYKANADEIVYWVITEDTQRTLAMANGTLDLSPAIAASDISKFREGGEYSDGIVVDQVLGNKAEYLLMNCSPDSVCSNLQLRQAICYALDIPTLVAGIYGDEAEAIYAFGNEMYTDYNPEWSNEDYYGFDQEKAMELIEESGLTDINLKLLCASGSSSEDMCVLIKEYLDMVGINVDLTILESAQVTDLRKDSTEWDMTIDSSGSTDYIVNLWVVPFDPETWTHGSMNFVEDDKLYELLDVARTEETHTQDNVDAVHEYMKDNAYVYGMDSAYSAFVHSDKITNIETDAKGFPIAGCCEFID